MALWGRPFTRLCTPARSIEPLCCSFETGDSRLLWYFWSAASRGLQLACDWIKFAKQHHINISDILSKLEAEGIQYWRR